MSEAKTEAIPRHEWQVDVPEGRSGPVEIRKEVVRADSLQVMMAAMQGGRGTPTGEYTMLYRRGSLWMSDTAAEWSDHYPAVSRIRRVGGRVLINGLGIGMVVRAALQCENVTHVDVVEIDEDVIRLVGPTYEADPRVKIHHGDAYEIQWPKGVRWDVAWHDIWRDLCVDNLQEMAVLHRKYGRRVDWQGSWGKELLLAERRREQRQGGWGW